MLKRITLYLALLLTLILPNASFAQSEKKIACGILLDNTGSLRSQFKYAKALGKGAIERIYQQGPIALFRFETQGAAPKGLAVVTSGVEWTQNKSVLDNYIDDLVIQPGITTLLDGIYSITEKMDNKVNLDKEAFAGKTILLITDGEDRASKIKEKQVIEKLKGSGIRFYAIGLVEELDSEGGLVNKSPKQKAMDFLKKAAKETGGRAVFPKSNKVDVNSLLNELFTESGHK